MWDDDSRVVSDSVRIPQTRQHRRDQYHFDNILGSSLPEEHVRNLHQFEEFQQQQQQQQLYSTNPASFRDQFRLSDFQTRLYSDGNLRGSLLLSGSSTLSRLPSTHSSHLPPPTSSSRLTDFPSSSKLPSAATFLPAGISKLRAEHLGMRIKAQSTDRLFQHGMYTYGRGGW